MLTYSFTTICMAPTALGNETQLFNHTSVDAHKNLPMWSVAVGSMIGTFPFSVAYAHFGARWVLFAAGVLSAVATALIPLALDMGVWYFAGLRFLQGIAYSADFAAIGLLCSRWGPLNQQAIFVSTFTCFSSLSSMLTNSISGLICESSFGWRTSTTATLPFVCYSSSCGPSCITTIRGHAPVLVPASCSG
ncbi:Protein Y4C6B.4 a [Aphelenchoides avenae]|nr:Protein Y4C6B.4 a [Aphelenchus avenae]